MTLDFDQLILDDDIAYYKLIQAIESNDPVWLQELIDSGVPVNSKDEGGFTPLYRAAQVVESKCLIPLILAGAVVSRQVWGAPATLDGSALNTAIRCGAYGNAVTLLDHGADPMIKDAQGRSALHFAVGCFDSEQRDEGSQIDLLSRILDKVQNVNDVDNSGRTALHLAIETARPPEVVATLLSRGLSLDIRAVSGRTPVHGLWHSGNISLLPILIEAGADLRTECDLGCPPMFYAMDPKALEVMIELGADPLAVDQEGRQALGHAVWRRWIPETVVGLLELGNDPSHVDKSGKSVYTLIEEDDSGRRDSLGAVIRSWAARKAMASIRSRAAKTA